MAQTTNTVWHTLTYPVSLTTTTVHCMDSKCIFDYVYMSDGIFAAIFLMKLAFNYTPSNATNKKKKQPSI